ncbi:unnamed protein product [Owenia fusiformis]|uniref:Uncharacterized protein n=1 Tax=Owenia fusiformis TaxID=6347 RepID=A0A8J1TWD6_OWEFU|nr:unnamed protein product [Owenia fusiformis]
MLGLIAVAALAGVIGAAVAYYFTCRTKHKEVSVSTFIQAPPEAVFNFIKEPDNMMHVHPSIIHIAVTERDVDRYGTERLTFTQEERLCTFYVNSLSMPKEGRMEYEFTTPSKMPSKLAGTGWFKGDGVMSVEASALDGHYGSLLTSETHLKTPHMKEASAADYLYETRNKMLENVKSYIENGGQLPPKKEYVQPPPPEPVEPPAVDDTDVDAEVAAVTDAASGVMDETTDAKPEKKKSKFNFKKDKKDKKPKDAPPPPPSAEELSKEIDL